ncbi:hypothetical protein I4U23_012125 [Adineta vaga]|nr:hypothetical protein I4U23_012125 [Adineta vaga]
MCVRDEVLFFLFILRLRYAFVENIWFHCALSIVMGKNKWFYPIESMFYEALEFHKIANWKIQIMPPDVKTNLNALKKDEEKEWPFRTHNAKAVFVCYYCKRTWKSSFTTIVWRAQRSTSIVQLRIEKQGCQRCNRKCQGFLYDGEQAAFTLYWMCTWILDVFYGIRSEHTKKDDDDKSDEIDESAAPHDYQRCEAGKKNTCRKCNLHKQRRHSLHRN